MGQAPELVAQQINGKSIGDKEIRMEQNLNKDYSGISRESWCIKLGKLIFVFLVSLSLLQGCSKDDDGAAPKSRKGEYKDKLPHYSDYPKCYFDGQEGDSEAVHKMLTGEDNSRVWTIEESYEGVFQKGGIFEFNANSKNPKKIASIKFRKRAFPEDPESFNVKRNTFKALRWKKNIALFYFEFYAVKVGNDYKGLHGAEFCIEDDAEKGLRFSYVIGDPSKGKKIGLDDAHGRGGGNGN